MEEEDPRLRTLTTLLQEKLAPYTYAPIVRHQEIAGVRRAADLLMAFPMGWRIAHLLQCDAIEPATLLAQTLAFEHAGVDVLWWFTDSAWNKQNRAWSLGVIGCCLSLVTAEESEKQDWVPLAWGHSYEEGWWSANLFERGEHFTDLWKRLALVRYLQLWGGVNVSRFQRAVQGTSELGRSFHGMVGALHRRALLERSVNGRWYPRTVSQIYPTVRRLPLEGVSQAHTFARAYAEARSAARTS